MSLHSLLRMMKILAFIILVDVAHLCLAQSCIAYNADEGTTPDAQGWFMGTNGVESCVCPEEFFVSSGVLHQSTLPETSIACENPPDNSSEPQALWWEQSFIGLNLNDAFTIEFTVRIVNSQYNENPCPNFNWPRPGFAVSLADVQRRFIWTGLGNGKLFLANSSEIPFGDPGVVEKVIPTRDDFHVYRVEGRQDGLALFIDEIQQLNLTMYGTPDTHVGPNVLTFGDGTGWANSEFELKDFWFKTGCFADQDGDSVVGVDDVDDFIADLLGPHVNVGCSPADLDGDKDCDLRDFARFQRRFGKDCLAVR